VFTEIDLIKELTPIETLLCQTKLPPLLTFTITPLVEVLPPIYTFEELSTATHAAMVVADRVLAQINAPVLAFNLTTTNKELVVYCPTT
jgi:hypothetical protein